MAVSPAGSGIITSIATQATVLKDAQLQMDYHAFANDQINLKWLF